MDHLYFLLGTGVILLLTFALSLRQAFVDRFRLPYVAEETLFSPSERAFKSVLERAVGQEYQVYGKVRVADIIGVGSRVGRRGRERAYARIGERCFDFIVCSRETTAIRCAIALAPSSRLRKEPRKDALDRICAAARLPFVRFRESPVYSVVEIEEQVFAAMSAFQTGSREEEVATPEAKTVLASLSEVVLDEVRDSTAKRSQATRPSLGTRRPAARSHATQSSPAEGRNPRRIEPVLRDPGEIEEGLAYRIDLDLDDDPRVRKTRP